MATSRASQTNNASTGPLVVGLGESLFDCFDDRQVLGGAPLNAAVCAHQLLAPVNGQGVCVTRVGNDDLGRQVAAELTARRMSTGYVQVDDRWPTGRALVQVKQGEPVFEIVADVAWDWLAFDPPAERVASLCSAVCFGTLGQRCEPARQAVQQFVEQAPQALRLFDVNLRQQYFSAAVVRRSAELANVLKVNQHELPVIVELLELATPDTSTGAMAQALREKFNLNAVVLTRGAAGTVAFTADGATEGAPVSYPRHPQADSVGAGDACSAGLLVGLLLTGSWSASVELANHTGAFVASMPGATPTLPPAILDRVTALARSP
ncbi:MAG: carbohydrate kinase [Planctomycetes bacterium]|nr:carbohydrate kinase [Planctomycetota bacterium]